MSRNNNSDKPVIRILLIVFALVNLQISVVFSAATPVQNNNNLLKEAESHYHEGRFEQTLKLIRQFLQSDSVSKPQRIKAYTLLSKIFIAQDKTASAKKIIHKIFALNPAYHPTLEQEKPSYVNLVNTVRNALKSQKATVQKKKPNTLFWAGTGGVAALTILVGILLSGGENGGNSHTLPKPPEFPTK